MRLALGATPGSLMGLALRHGLRLTLIGLGLGVGIGMLVPGAGKADPLAIGGAVILMVLAAGLACFGPARRAGRLDPALVLRHD